MFDHRRNQLPQRGGNPHYGFKTKARYAKAAALNRAALVTLVQMAEAIEQQSDEAVSPGDGTLTEFVNFGTGGSGYQGKPNPKDNAEIAEKVNQIKTIKLAMQAGQITADAFQQNIVEAAVAEQLGILTLLGQIQTNLSAERAELAGWLNQRGRGELRL